MHIDSVDGGRETAQPWVCDSDPGPFDVLWTFSFKILGQLKAGVRVVLHQGFSACFKYTESISPYNLLLLAGVNTRRNSGVD